MRMFSAMLILAAGCFAASANASNFFANHGEFEIAKGEMVEPQRGLKCQVVARVENGLYAVYVRTPSANYLNRYDFARVSLSTPAVGSVDNCKPERCETYIDTGILDSPRRVIGILEYQGVARVRVTNASHVVCAGTKEPPGTIQTMLDNGQKRE